jgi:hypothetical protein
VKTSFLSAVLFVFLSSVCPAAYIQWDGGAGTTNWNAAQNWNGDVIPGTADKAGFKTATGAVVATTVPTFMQMTLGSNQGNGILTVQPGAVINCTDTWAMGQSSGETGTLNISGGNITVGSWFYVGNAGIGTVNMTGGSINVSALFSIAFAAGSTGTVNLDSGTITAATFSMAPGGGTARLNITAGKLIVNGNITATIATYIGSGWIKGYDSASNVRYDYNITTSGKTTVWAVGSTKANNPTPANGASNISRNTSLSWTAGPGAVSHNVYFGTTSPGAFCSNQTGTTFDPNILNFNTTYYWRIDEVSGPNTTTGDVWSFTTISGQAKNSDPANAAANIAIDKVLHWTAGVGAVSHDVYLGTVLNDVNNADRLIGDLDGDGSVDYKDISIFSDAWLKYNDENIVNFIDYSLLANDWMNKSSPVFKGNYDVNNFTPGPLAFNTTYYWRIDEVNGPDTVRGNIWSFNTLSGKSYNPNPANGASNLVTNTTLSWTAGAGATSHNVYFGTTNPPASIGNQTAATYAPGALANSTVYYWRIDEVEGSGTVTGDLWSFTTLTPSSSPVYPYLTWRNDLTNSVVVNWLNAAVQGDSTVDFGTTAAYGTTVNVPTITNTHHVELTGLTAGATYHYRVRSSDGTASSDNTYTVPVSSPSSFSFAVYGDPRGAQSSNEPYYTRHQALCNWILAQNFDFAYETGDIVWAGSTGLNVFWPDFYRLESNLSKSKVIMATMGNHEVQDAGDSTNYQSLYTAAFPTNGMTGTNGKTYSFNYGNAHFICMSSYQVDLNQQKTWLEADLITARANPNIKWIFAFMHAPMYTTNTTHLNRTDCTAAWGPLFDTYHVDIVFAGHNHLYERSKSIKSGAAVADGVGTVYLTSGLGGASFDSPGSGSPGLFLVTYNSLTLATCVTINGNQLTVNAISNSDNMVHDTFTLSK